jgi:predicted flap endonuclease-1-like 5' DNA nuclease
MSHTDKKSLVVIAGIIWVFLVFNTITGFSLQGRFMWEILVVIFGSAALGWIAKDIWGFVRAPETSAKNYTIESLEKEIHQERQEVVISAEDDLKVIEGVGPKIEELFKKEGILTWKQMSETDSVTMASILEKAGPRFKLNNPKTWAKQARLAHAGKWQELEELKDGLIGGL